MHQETGIPRNKTPMYRVSTHNPESHERGEGGSVPDIVMDIAVGCYAYGNMFWCM